jgi:sugar-specific transcriptional regulator TrmB
MREALRQIGLTKGETDVYLALIELGQTTTGPIRKEADISGSKVYEVLERLQDKGLASCTEIDGVNHYEAAHPRRILDYLDRKQQAIEEDKTTIQSLIPDLLARQDHDEETKISVFTGFEGLKTANQDIIATLNEGETWYEMGLTDQPRAWERYFNKKQHVRAKQGIIHKAIINKDYESVYKARNKLPHTEYRRLPQRYEMPISIDIYNDNVTIFVLLKDDPVAIRMSSEAIAKSFKQYWELLWEVTEKA